MSQPRHLRSLLPLLSAVVFVLSAVPSKAQDDAWAKYKDQCKEACRAKYGNCANIWNPEQQRACFAGLYPCLNACDRR
jgi:hypothetical protein